jgi:hypothetical protein
MSYAMAPMPNKPHSIIAIGGYGHDDLMHGNKKYSSIYRISDRRFCGTDFWVEVKNGRPAALTRRCRKKLAKMVAFGDRKA